MRSLANIASVQGNVRNLGRRSYTSERDEMEAD
jgi:hypothetical protein